MQNPSCHVSGPAATVAGQSAHPPAKPRSDRGDPGKDALVVRWRVATGGGVRLSFASVTPPTVFSHARPARSSAKAPGQRPCRTPRFSHRLSPPRAEGSAERAQRGFRANRSSQPAGHPDGASVKGYTTSCGPQGLCFQILYRTLPGPRFSLSNRKWGKPLAYRPPPSAPKRLSPARRVIHRSDFRRGGYPPGYQTFRPEHQPSSRAGDGLTDIRLGS